MQRSVHLVLGVVVFSIAIIGMLTPGLRVPFGIPDPVAHVLVLFGISFLAMVMGFVSENKCFILLLPFALILELGQYFVPGRSVEWVDIFCNFYGVFLAFSAIWVLRKLLPANRAMLKQ